MKYIKWFKWIFSILILIGALIAIIWGTNYILNNNGLKKQEKKEIKHTIEKVTSNETSNNLSEIYNIYLNNEKHKVKMEYQLLQKSEESLYILLYIYFDGKKSLEMEVASLIENSTIHSVFLNEDIGDNIKISESSFKILKEKDTEYLLVNIGIIDSSTKKYYYIINNNGDIVNNKGILVSDSNKDYLMGEHEFNNYYDLDNKTLAKIDGNEIFALEEKTEKKKLKLIEYKYYFKDGKLKKDKVAVFEDIKIKVTEEKE
jgi:hypothetical protein